MKSENKQQQQNMKIPDHIYSLETSITTTKVSEVSEWANTQDKDFNIAIVNKFKVVKDNMNKYMNEDHENRVG